MSNTNIYEVEMQAPARVGVTKYVEAESEAQAEAVAQAWAEDSFFEEWSFCADGPGAVDDIDAKQLLGEPDIESARKDPDLLQITRENCLHERVRVDSMEDPHGEPYRDVTGTCEVCGAAMETTAEIQGADDEGNPLWVVGDDWDVQ